MTASERANPPPYSVHSTGFPSGYFLIQNLANGRILDVEEKKKDDARREASSDNQVFFVDYLGNLCSKHSGHGIDVEEDGRLVLRHRQPMTSSFPSCGSHPLPCFNYSPVTGHITLTLAYNPVYSGSKRRESKSSSEQTYILTAITATKPRDVFDDATSFLIGASSALTLTSSITTIFSRKALESKNKRADVQRQELELREDELSEVDRETLDDSTDLARPVKAIPLSARSGNVDPEMSKRERWEILSVD